MIESNLMTRLPSTTLRRLHPWLVLAAAVGVYLNSLGNGFAYDDVFIIQSNTRVHDLANLRDILLTPYWPSFGRELGLYRPFAILLYAVQWAVGGGAAWVFHAFSIALHAMATLLVFLLMERLAGRVPALVGGLIFAVHPVHTEAVANIVGQAEIVACIAVLAGCLVHVSRPPGLAVSWPRRIALVVCFGIGIGTKESAVVLPGLLVAADFLQRRVHMSVRGWVDYARAMAMPVFLLVATLSFYLVARYDALSGALMGVDAGPSLPFLREEYRVLNALRAFPEYVRLLLVPLDLSADYSPGVVLAVESLSGMTLLGLLLLIGLTALMLATPWIPAAGFAPAWFLIAISPVSNIFFPIGVLIAERTLYLPSVAVSAFVALLWQRAGALTPLRTRRLVPALAVAVILLFGVRTWIRNPDWESTHTLLASLQRDHPESYRAQWVRAELLSQLGHPLEAEDHYTLAYRLHGRDSQLLSDYARYLQRTGRPEQAVEMFQEAHRLHPYVPATTVLLAHAYLVVGRYADALEMTRRAEELGTPFHVSMTIRAHAWHGLGAHDHAVAAWRAASRDATVSAWVVSAFLARSLAIAGYESAALDTIRGLRAAATDSLAAERLAALDSVIRDGCYAGAIAAAPRVGQTEAGAAHVRRPMPRMPGCDVLGDWFIATGQAKIATKLHNAIEMSSSGAAQAAGSAP